MKLVFHYNSCADSVKLPWAQYHWTRTHGVICISLVHSSSTQGYLIEGCHGTYTGKSHQSTDGICVDTQTTPIHMRSDLYFRLERVAIGKYYFDCHTEDGAVFPVEIVACKFQCL